MVAKVSAWASKFTCHHHLLKSSIFSAPTLARSFCLKSYHHRTSLHNVCKVFFGQTAGPPYERQNILFMGHRWIHYSRFLHMDGKDVESTEHCRSNTIGDGADDAKGSAKVKRKRPKGKKAVVKWLKNFRWKKKKEYERMTAEEKILFKLKKARRKEERYVEALGKIVPKESSETIHDPEILTPEEHFFFLQMGLKVKHYVPIGRRGIYQGVILNMHLHWKKHQTLQVVVKTFTPDEVKEIAVELARLSGGIVLDIHEENTIIMYRGKNYSQPPTDIMSPRVALHRIKALKKSKYRDGLRTVRKYIPRLELELDMFGGRSRSKTGMEAEVDEDFCEGADADGKDAVANFTQELANSDKLKEIMTGNDYPVPEEEDSSLGSGMPEEEDSSLGSGTPSDSEALSDIFETDSDLEVGVGKGKGKGKEAPLYLDLFNEFPMKTQQEQESFGEHSQQICADSDEVKDESKLDEADQVFLRAASLLMKKRR